MRTLLGILMIVAGVTSIDFRRDEAHKYFLPNMNGTDICNQMNCTMNANFGTVNFFLFNQNNRDVPLFLNEYNLHNINPALDTKVIFHGWNEGYNATWVIDMKNTFLSVGDYNVILPDYYYYTSQPIMMGCCYTRSLSEVVGYFLVQLTTEVSLNLKRVHLIGASLGAQVAGIVGDTIKVYSNGIKVGRITGLDTTYMLFRGRPFRDRLTPDDADFVDTIHTNSGDMGYPDPHGHVDFYPNCGITQPQCGNETGAIRSLCDHSMSHVFFNATIFNPTIYVGVACLSCDDYLSGRCNGNPTVIMGENTPPTARGVYFLEIYDDLRPLIINAINAGEFDDNPPPSLQGNEILEQRRERARMEQGGNSSQNGNGIFNDLDFGFELEGFLTTQRTTTTTSTEPPIYPNTFELSNLRVPGIQYQSGLTGLGSNPDPAGDRLRAQAATSTTTQRSRGNARFQDNSIDDYSNGQPLRRVSRMREVPSFMRRGASGRSRNNLSVPNYYGGSVKNFEFNAALLGAESNADPYGSYRSENTPPASPQMGSTLPLPTGNPAVLNERYLANRFNYTLGTPIGPGNLPLGGLSPNQPVYQNSANTGATQPFYPVTPIPQRSSQRLYQNQQGTQSFYRSAVSSNRPNYQTSGNGNNGNYFQGASVQAQGNVWNSQTFTSAPAYTDPTAGRSRYNDYDYDSTDDGQSGQTYQFYTSYNNRK